MTYQVKMLPRVTSTPSGAEVLLNGVKQNVKLTPSVLSFSQNH